LGGRLCRKSLCSFGLHDSFDCWHGCCKGNLSSAGRSGGRVESRRIAMTITEGTIIHGTLRLEDLIPAFIAELRVMESIKPGADERAKVIRYQNISHTLSEIERAMEDPLYFDGDEAPEDCDWIMDRLNKHAPDGMYFGAHQGDGSDFGWWTVDED
jgi:hypothetical protein